MEGFAKIHGAMRSFFESHATLDLSFRKEGLKRLAKAITEFEPQIFSALSHDLGKSNFETYATEIAFVQAEISFHLNHLDRWARRKRVLSSLMSAPSFSYTIARPKGVVLVIAPWNYPLQLALVPLISAVAAGNCVVVKPSTKSQATAAVIEELLHSVFDAEHVRVNTDRAVLDYQWDHIFFTGGAQVGRHIAAVAAQTLTPTTLELGGKSPVIVTKESNIALAARRIAWGKCLNSGQTCVAPDYLLVHHEVAKPLIEALKGELTGMFGSDPLGSEDLATIIDDEHFGRLISLFEDGKLLWGGQIDPKRRRIAPTLLSDVDLSSTLMTEEIFGPILPIIEFSTFDEALAFIAGRPTPLAAYLFSSSGKQQRRFVETLPFGGGCINDVVMHLTNPRLPFGGLSESGMGVYHGESGFRTFSHIKSIVRGSSLIDIPVRYAPYSGRLALLKKLLR